MKAAIKLSLILISLLLTKTGFSESHQNFNEVDTTVSTYSSENDFLLIKKKTKRNHTISIEATNYYLWFPAGLNYDVNLYRKNNFLLGGTASIGLIGAKLGVFAGFRQSWEDMIKVETGLGLTAGWGDGFVGPYTEFGYRSQRDTRSFFWEVSAGYIINTFEPNIDEFGMFYGGASIGFSF